MDDATMTVAEVVSGDVRVYAPEQFRIAPVDVMPDDMLGLGTNLVFAVYTR